MYEINGKKYIKVEPEQRDHIGMGLCQGCAFVDKYDDCPTGQDICTNGKMADWIIWKEVTEDE